MASDLSDICVPRENHISRLQASRGCGLLVVLAFLLHALVLTLTLLVLHFRTVSEVGNDKTRPGKPALKTSYSLS